ncbi:MAG TPA: PilZ domain-containing protein [Candidatus Omnitrophota bacterium]|nr:PilZ domain-containing protein [Candidatus Omnitrophota bacterium]HPS19433.1 PilZ domain-containing protein [Candidatus Omnitrophota bacterium]
MKERRKEKRALKYFAVNIVSVDTNGKSLRFDNIKRHPKFYDESGLDFSPDGVKIMCSKTLPPESKIQMKMLIPDDTGLNLMKANGTIKWFKQVKGKYKKYFILGVHFRDMNEKDKDTLVELWKKYSE